MAVLQSDQQWCPNQEHDGQSGKDGFPPSRAFWPLNFFDKAVASWRASLKPTVGEAAELPDLDFDLEV